MDSRQLGGGKSTEANSREMLPLPNVCKSEPRVYDVAVKCDLLRALWIKYEKRTRKLDLTRLVLVC